MFGYTESIEEIRDSISGVHYRRKNNRETLTAPTLHAVDNKKNANTNNDNTNVNYNNTNSSSTNRISSCGSNSFNNNNIELYIKLASQCYHEGFQSHLNYLDECNRNSVLLKKCFESKKRATAISNRERTTSQRSQNIIGTRRPTTNNSDVYFLSQFDNGNKRRDTNFYCNSQSEPINQNSLTKSSMILNIRVDLINNESLSENNLISNNLLISKDNLTENFNINEIMTTSNFYLNNNSPSSALLINNSYAATVEGLTNNLNNLNLLDATTTSEHTISLPKIVLTDFSKGQVTSGLDSGAVGDQNLQNSCVSVSAECEIQDTENNFNMEDDRCKVMTSNFLNIENNESNFCYESRPPLKN